MDSYEVRVWINSPHKHRNMVMYISFSLFFLEPIHIYNELLQVVDLASSWLKEKRVSLNIRQFPDEWHFIVISHAV